MESIFEYLKELNAHNDREWFNAHKDDYRDAKARFDRFALELADAIRDFDDSIGPLGINDITFRIYRDVRFSTDKSPYKCHMGAYIAPGGRKSGYSGYYIQVSGSDKEGWESFNMVAAGNYFCEPKALKIIREDIEMGESEFRNIVESADPRLYLDMSGALKRVPNGYDPLSPNADFLRLKTFCLQWEPEKVFFTAPDLVNRLAAIFKTTAPFIHYVNRAIEYSREN